MAQPQVELKAKPKAKPTRTRDFPFSPQKGPITRKHAEKALRVKPMAKLLPFLAPLGRYAKTRPPKFHFGWVLEDPNVLLETAKDLGVTGEGYDIDDSDDDDEMDSDDEKEPRPTITMREIYLREDALTAVSKKLELAKEPYLAKVFSGGKDNALMVSLVENYSLKGFTGSGRDVKSLMEFFKFKTGPRWYIDAYMWMWDSESYWLS
ncbi:hypothetical protein SCHPADRAFT_294870 [Schizopora paradoxa]|uniref:Uncharacterized protein n=1 Tax=Schizopora paradoxa TaxID=27342 RepID=A0A0H2RSJ9_9AGAM|nr:hypothetical protein SCHPADRAFT_294870 [Schizopora paradoxa]